MIWGMTGYGFLPDEQTPPPEPRAATLIAKGRQVFREPSPAQPMPKTPLRLWIVYPPCIVCGTHRQNSLFSEWMPTIYRIITCAFPSSIGA